MPRYTADYMCRLGLAPLNVYDASGRIIRRAIVAFDTDTGEVVSRCLDRSGQPIEEPLGEFKNRTKFYRAPLSFRKITDRQVELEKVRYLDLQGK